MLRSARISAGKPSPREIGALAVLLGIAAIVQVGFVVVTGWTLEDAMILARIARTFAETGVLAFHPSAAISTATSPPFALLVGVLATLGVEPLLAARILGGVSTLGVGVVVFAVARRVVDAGAFFAAAIYLLLPTTVAYATCGLETATYTLAAVGALAAAYARRHGPALALATIATLLRPDGGLVALVVFAVRLLDLRSTCEPRARRRELVHALRDGVVAALVVLVGAAIHFRVYGTWMPWSVVAKGMAYEIEPWSNLLGYLRRMLFSQKAGLVVYAMALVGVGVAWRRDRRLFLFAAWYAIYLLAFGLRAPLFSWYLQPLMPVVALFAGLGVSFGIDLAAKFLRVAPARLRVVAAMVLVVGALFAVDRYAAFRRVDAVYERDVRRAAGEWLARNAPADALVFTESLGHVGYPNRLRFVDWPGLVSREVPGRVEGVSQIEGYRRVIDEFIPDFLVLREGEVEELGVALDGYVERARFDSALRGPAYRVLERDRVSSGGSHHPDPEVPR